MASKTKQMRLKTEYDNDLMYRQWREHLELISLTMFRWEGLPKSISSYYLNRLLMFNGSCVIFDHQDIGIIASKYNNYGKLNYQDEPVMYQVHVRGFGVAKIDAKKCVIMRNNPLKTGVQEIIHKYSLLLYETEKAILANTKVQKIPFIFRGSQKTMNSYYEMFRQIEEGHPAVFVDDEVDIDNKAFFITNPPMVVNKLQEFKTEIKREVYSMFAVQKSVEKKERVSTAEVSAGNAESLSLSQIMLDSRQQGCDAYNELFGGNLKVELRPVVIAKEVDEVGNVLNNATPVDTVGV